MFDDMFKNYPDMDCDGDQDIFDFMIYSDEQNVDKPRNSYDDEDEEDEFWDDEFGEHDDEYDNDDDVDWEDSDQGDCC